MVALNLIFHLATPQQPAAFRSRATWLPWNRSGPVYTSRSPDLGSSLGHHQQSTSGLRRSCSCCRSWSLRASLEILTHVLGLSLVSRL